MGGGKRGSAATMLPPDYPDRSQSATPTMGMGKSRKSFVVGRNGDSPPPRRAQSRLDHVKLPRLGGKGNAPPSSVSSAFKASEPDVGVDEVGVDQRMQRMVQIHEQEVMEMQRTYNQLHIQWVQRAQRLVEIQSRVEEERVEGELSDGDDEDDPHRFAAEHLARRRGSVEIEDVADRVSHSFEVRHAITDGMRPEESLLDFRERLLAQYNEAFVNTGLIHVEQRSRMIMYERVKPQSDEARRRSTQLREVRDHANRELEKLEMDLVKSKETEHTMRTHVMAEREALRQKRQLWEKKRLVLLKMAATGTMTPEYRKALEIRQKLWRRSFRSLLGGSKSQWYKDVMEDIEGVTADVKTVKVQGPRRTQLKALPAPGHASDADEAAGEEVIDEPSDEEEIDAPAAPGAEGEGLERPHGYAPALYAEIANTEAHKWLERDVAKRRQRKERSLKMRIGTEVKRNLIDQEKSDYDREYERLEEFFELVKTHTGLGFEDCDTIADIVHPRSEKRRGLEELAADSQRGIEAREGALKGHRVEYDQLMAFGTMSKQFRDEMDRAETGIETAETRMFLRKQRSDGSMRILKDIEFAVLSVGDMLESVGVRDPGELISEHERRARGGAQAAAAARKKKAAAAAAAAAASGDGEAAAAATATAAAAVVAPAAPDDDDARLLASSRLSAPTAAGGGGQLVGGAAGPGGGARAGGEESAADAVDAVQVYGAELQAGLGRMGDTLGALLGYLESALPPELFIPGITDKSLESAMALAPAEEALDEVVEMKNRSDNVRVQEGRELNQAELIKRRVQEDLQEQDTGDGDDDDAGAAFLGERGAVKDHNAREIARIERTRALEAEAALATPHEGRVSLMDRQASTRGGGAAAQPRGGVAAAKQPTVRGKRMGRGRGRGGV